MSVNFRQAAILNWVTQSWQCEQYRQKQESRAIAAETARCRCILLSIPRSNDNNNKDCLIDWYNNRHCSYRMCHSWYLGPIQRKKKHMNHNYGWMQCTTCVIARWFNRHTFRHQSIPRVWLYGGMEAVSTCNFHSMFSRFRAIAAFVYAVSTSTFYGPRCILLVSTKGVMSQGLRARRLPSCVVCMGIILGGYVRRGFDPTFNFHTTSPSKHCF